MAARDQAWVAPGIDTTKPSMARIYDYFLGGKDNYTADRRLAEEFQECNPDSGDVARANRRFLGRAVRFLAEAGIRQFLDLGTGLPSQNNVHEVAQRIHPDARVVYVDNDPVVLAHARALLAKSESTIVVHEDMRNAARIFAHPAVRCLLDFSQPVAVLFVSVLHFVTDDDEARGVVAAMTERLVPGSYLTLSHGTFDDHPHVDTGSLEAGMRHTSTPAAARSRETITRFFDGFDLVDPGLVPLTAWRSHDLERARRGGAWMLAGVGRKR